MRKLKLLENDLDQAEDKNADGDSKMKDMEAQMEELTRENKQYQHRVNVLEGEFNIYLSMRKLIYSKGFPILIMYHLGKNLMHWQKLPINRCRV